MPTFIGVGPQRTGTTWLHEMLRGHVGLPSIKETDFFSKHYDKGLDWYLAFFEDCPPAVPMGEIDPNYFAEVDARERIARHVPDCRIICTLREPVDRAYSSWRTMRRDDWTSADFEQTVAASNVIRESSRYAFHLRAWQERFGAERVLVCLYDDLEADPQRYLDRICDFIGISTIQMNPQGEALLRVNTVTEAPRNRRVARRARKIRDWMRRHRWHRAIDVLDRAGVWRYCFAGGEEFGQMAPEAKDRLRRMFRPEVDELEILLGRDLSSWKDRTGDS